MRHSQCLLDLHQITGHTSRVLADKRMRDLEPGGAIEQGVISIDAHQSERKGISAAFCTLRKH